jgi:uncharacterized protein YtpQ (UPF0354 family)
MTSDDVLSRILPQFFPSHWLDPPGIVYTDFPSRIRIGYVIRDEGRYSYFCGHEFSALCITLEELHAAALANLTRYPSAKITIAKILDGAEGWISATDDNFAAVRILLPHVQQEFQTELGEEFLVSLPHRDDCFCWSLAQPEERQESNAREALEHFLLDDYNLTPDIFLYSSGTFRLHRQQIAD